MGRHKTEARKLLDKINWSQIVKNYSLKELADIFQLPQSVIQDSASEHYKKIILVTFNIKSYNFINFHIYFS